MRNSFGAQIRWLVVALCAGFGFAVLGSFHFLAQRQISAAADRDAQTVSTLLGNMIRGRSQLLDSLTNYVADSPRVKYLALSDRTTVQDAVSKGLRDQIGVDAFLVADRRGQILGADGFEGSKVIDEPFLADALAGKTRRAICDRDGELVMASIQPMRIGEFVQGAFAAYLKLSDDRAREIKRGASFEIAFLHDGRITGGSRALPEFRVLADEPWQVQLDGKTFVARYAQLPGTGKEDKIGFVVMRPLDDILGPYHDFSLAFLSVLAVTALLALVGGSQFATGIVHSLDGLVRAAGELKRGEWPSQLPAVRRDEIGLLEGTFNGMTESLRASQERLLAMIDTDPLTDLLNHRRFKQALGQETARALVTGESLVLILFDLDDFSGFNEANGHLVGDAMLRRFGEGIRQQMPEFGTAARYSGDQFAVLLPRVGTDEVRRVYDELVEFMGVPLSAGFAELLGAGRSIEGLTVAAELALHRAKELGRNQICDFGTVAGSEAGDPVALNRILSDGTYATIRALAAAVDAKDAYTHGHSERVAKYATDLAEFVGASTAELDLIHRCGTLHDVGKIGIPDAILQKAGRLDEEEFRTMCTHAVLGEYIVSKVPQLADLLPGVRHHHERYDGKGYPDGLAGEAIPRVARFLAIADTFDAMTSDRPYRKGMDMSIAIREIVKGAGTQFDPDLAAAFAELWSEVRLAA